MIPPVDKEKPALLTLYLNGFGRQGEANAEHDAKKDFLFGGIP